MKRIGVRAGLVTLVLVGLAICALAWTKWGAPIQSWVRGRTRSDSTRLADATSAYEAGDWKRTADLARPLLKSKAGDLEALRLYARASARMEHDSSAAAIYMGRLRGSPMQTEDRFLIGLMQARAGQLDAAVDEWEGAARGDEGNAELLDHLARLSARLERYDEAADAARRLAQKPAWETKGQLLLGDIRAALDDPQGSIEAIRAALARNPSARGGPYPPSHYRKLLARSLLQLGLPAEARKALEALRVSNGAAPLDHEAEWLLSRAWLQEGNLKEAASALSLAGAYRSENPLEKEPSPYVGEARCVSCHREVSRSHDPSRHARTFHRGRGLLALPLPDRPLADPDDAEITHAFKREDDKIKVETRDGDEVSRLIVEYAFGTSDRYVTMVGRDEARRYRAARFSSYHTKDGIGWDRSAGDVPDYDASENRQGAPIRVRDGVVRCLYCHTTFYRDFRDPPPAATGPEAADRAIGCERCHGPGGNHVKAIEGNFAESAIMNAGAGGAKAIAKLCADCHIVGSRAQISKTREDPKWVRSAGLTLTFSECYSESGGAMSCMTCHDAHRDDHEPASFYEAKCLSCHAARVKPEKNIVATGPGIGSAPAGKKPTFCPVNATTKCLECHMPKVPMPTLHGSLTDHYIRVREPGGRK